MKSLLLILLITVALISCAPNARPPWYQTQGITMTECGPTAAAMAASWAGVKTSRFQARAVFVQPLFWRLTNIESMLQSRGVSVHRRPISLPALGEMGIYHVDGIHFVNVTRTQAGRVEVYDPMGGIYPSDSHEFMQRITHDEFLLIRQ